MRIRVGILLLLLTALVIFLVVSKVVDKQTTPTATSLLSPCVAPTSGSAVTVEYLKRVAATLKVSAASDAVSGELLARAVVTPGWRDPEWVVSVYDRPDDAIVELVEAEMSVWLANHPAEDGRWLREPPVAVESRRSTCSLPTSLARQIGRTWHANLLNVRSVEDKRVYVDTTTYTFVRDMAGEERLCGETKSRVVPLGLAQLAVLLRDYVKADDSDRKTMLERIREKAI